MTFQIALVLILVTITSALLISERLRPDLVALLLLIVLGLSGLVTPLEMFSGFSRPAVITILSIFVITAALEHTGASRALGQQLNRLAGDSEPRAVLVVMIATALLSLVMNNIAAAAVLLPAAIGISKQTAIRPSKLLIPLAFASNLGGMATLYATANILVSAVLVDQGLAAYRLLDFLPVGLPMALAGILFVALVGRRWLPSHAVGGQPGPNRRTGGLSETYGLTSSVSGVYVKPGSDMAGLSLADGHWSQRFGVNVVAISRGNRLELAPVVEAEVLAGDVVVFTGQADRDVLSDHGLVPTNDPAWHGQFTSDQVSLVEVTLPPRSGIAGKTLRDINFRSKFNLSVIALWREGNTLQHKLIDMPLRFGDALLVQGQRDRINLLRQEPDFLILDEDVHPVASPRKAILAVALMLLAVGLPVANLLPIAEAAFTVAWLMVLLGCLTMDEAYGSVEWRAIFLIAAMLPLGIALTNSGAAALIGGQLVRTLGTWGPLAVAAGIYLVTMLLTQVMGGPATAVVLTPIAIAAARQVGVDPRGMAMAVAMGCSTVFLTPFAHASNLLVMGPGGYRFKDYARVGLPLSLVLFVVFLITLPWFWHIR